MKYISVIGERKYEIELFEVEHQKQVQINGSFYALDIKPLTSSNHLSIIIDNKSYEVVLSGSKGNYQCHFNGRAVPIYVEDEKARLFREMGFTEKQDAGAKVIKAPMPGLIVAVEVSKGQIVKKGESIIIIEAMKMENELKSPADGEIEEVFVKKGDKVDKDKFLVKIK